MTSKNLTNLKISSFTLAEVLITLTIICVIAALTVPNLIAKHDKEVAVTRLKKTYTTLSQAFKQIELNNPDFFDSIPSAYDPKVWYALDDELKPYLKVLTTCDYTSGDNEYKKFPACERITYKQLNGTLSLSDGLTKTNRATILEDGTILRYGNQGAICGFATSITVDINGKKGPNTFGKDTFIFLYSLYPRRLIPYGPNCDLNFINRSQLLSTDQIHSCTKQRSGRQCGALIMKDGWQIKDDYPW